MSSVKNTFKQIQLFYFIIIVMLAIFASVAYILVSGNGQIYNLPPATESNIKSLIIILTLAGVPASYMFHKRKVTHIDADLPSERKIQQYRNSFFIKISTLEGLSFISLLMYLVTSNTDMFLIFSLIYIFILLNFPKKSTILSELNIEPSDSKN